MESIRIDDGLSVLYIMGFRPLSHIRELVKDYPRSVAEYRTKRNGVWEIDCVYFFKYDHIDGIMIQLNDMELPDSIYQEFSYTLNHRNKKESSEEHPDNER